MRNVLLYIYSLLELSNSQFLQDQYRPQLHYSVPSGWMNDPNGFVYYNGYYHLFYQHNPYDTKWGPMYWGHSVSKDMIHWVNKPIAIRPYELGHIYSGSAIIDRANLTGFKKYPDVDPLVAIYTLDSNAYETQALAYSNDNGETFTQYENNPVITNPEIRDFRDPNVFLYKDAYYVMVLSAGDRTQFYRSNDLLKWSFMSEFGTNPNQGDKRGIFECPSIFELPATTTTTSEEEDTATTGSSRTNWSRSKWILMVSSNLNNDERGSVTQYFVGHFNGTHFINENDPSTTLYSDYGPDNFAAIPMSENPEKSVVIIGWMDNWLYSAYTPTATWRGQMTLPRTLSVQSLRNRWHLAQLPHDRVYKLRDYSRQFVLQKPMSFASDDLDGRIYNITQELDYEPRLLNLEAVWSITGHVDNGEIGFRFKNSLNEYVRIGYNFTTNKYYFDRMHSGQQVNQYFLRQTEVERLSDSSKLRWTIILDVSSLEFFGDNGLNVLTGLFYPNEDYSQVYAYGHYLNGTHDMTVSLDSLAMYGMDSIWN